jgi:hypothetical protein
VALLEDGAEKYDNLEKTVLSEERNKVFAEQQDGKCHFFDISLVNTKESAEDACCIMVEFAADTVPGFEPRRLEVLTSMLPNPVVCGDPELLECNFCDVAKHARAENREDADRVCLDPALLIVNVGGGFEEGKRTFGNQKEHSLRSCKGVVWHLQPEVQS